MSLEVQDSSPREKDHASPRFLQTRHQHAILNHLMEGGSLHSLLRDNRFHSSFQPEETTLFWDVIEQLETHEMQGGNIPSFLAHYYDDYLVSSVKKTIAANLDDPDSVDMGIDEVIDEARIRTYRAFERIGTGELAIDVDTFNIPPYVGRIGQRLALDRIRRTGLKHQHTESLEARALENDEGKPREGFSGSSPSAEHEALFRLFMDDMRKALDSDEVKVQMVIQAALTKGFDVHDLSRITGIPYDSIRMRMTRARRVLREKLQNPWEE